MSEPANDTSNEIQMYDMAADECRSVFIERGKMYVSYLNTHPFYNMAGLYIKATRFMTDMQNGTGSINRDTLIDMANYAIMIVSRMDNESIKPAV